MRVLFALFFVLAAFDVFSQNLVVNPSFETYSACPVGPSELDKATPWRDPFINLVGDTCSTSDYYNACSPFGSMGVGVPANILGSQAARTGDAYAGIIIYEGISLLPGDCSSLGGSGWREYVMGEFTSPLIAGQTYCISFWVSLADNVKWGSNSFGVHLSNTPVLVDCATVGANSDLGSYGITPQLTYSGPAIMNTTGWTQLQWNYTATGGENYIVIGNFNGNTTTNYECSNADAMNPYAYYYIDDVSVIANACPDPLTVCLEPNGDLTVSNGTGPFTWQEFIPGSTITITNQTQCEACGFSWIFGSCLNGVQPVTSCTIPGSYQFLASGQTITPGTNFPILVTDSNGATFEVTSLAALLACTNEPCPTITVTSSNQNNVTCFGGNNGTATVSASGGATPYTYSWTPGNLSGATQSQLTAGSYTVTATDGNGCTGQVVVTITQPTQLTATIAATDATCGADDGQLQVNPNGGTAPYTYVWTPNAGSTATVSNLAAGSYQVVVTDAAGCSITLNGNVNNANAPTLTLESSQNETCPGDADGSASVSASGGSGGYTYNWLPTGGNAAEATGLTAGNYVVTVTDSDGCLSSLNVTIGSQPAISLSGTVINEDCGQQNGQISLNASGGTGTLTYSWSNGQSTSSLTNLTFGDYTVVVTDQNGCSTQQTFTVETIGTIPVFVTPPVASIEAGESVDLEATGGVSYTWTPATGLSCTDCPNPTASPITTTTYTVSAVDEFGCPGDTTVTIFVQQLCGELFVPTIFSPNADGANDQHCVLGGCLTSFEFSIYNRWGERVFESTSQSACWDGMFRGKLAQTGVYVYKLKAVLIDGTEVKESGNINLVR
jgi:gliding motility-associated-like protein